MARTAQYTASVSALVSDGIKNRIDAIDAEYPEVSKGEVVRLALEWGMSNVEQRFPVPRVAATVAA